MTKICNLLIALVVLVITVAIVQAKQYEVLSLDQDGKFLLDATTRMRYFRVQLPYNTTNKFFEIDFSACSGMIKIYRSQCRTTDAGCDNNNDPWFPDSATAQHSLFTKENDMIQSTQTFGRIANDDQSNVVFFFGVEAVHLDANGQVQFHAILRTYDANTIAHSFINSHRLTLSGLTLSWQTLEYCGKANDGDGSICEKKIDITPIKYTVYIVNSNENRYNLGTACGLINLGASKNAKKKIATNSNTRATLSLPSNGNYIVGVAGDVPDPKHPVDYAYRPIVLSYYATTSYRPVVVLLFLAFMAAVIAVAAVGGYYFYKKKYVDGDEVTPLR